MQQNQQHLKIQLGTPTPPPEVPDAHSREMEKPFHHHKAQEALEGLVPRQKQERELGLPADGDKPPQDVPASAPATPQQLAEPDVTVVPIVQDLPFVAEAVKRQLQHHMPKNQIQPSLCCQRGSWPERKNSTDCVLGQKTLPACPSAEEHWAALPSPF